MPIDYGLIARTQEKMKVAIPLFGTRVAPRYEYARSVFIANIESREVVKREVLSENGFAAADRLKHLTDLDVKVVICGGIDRFSWRALSSSGITVISWITGEAEDALQCFLRGELEPGGMMGPGGRCRGRWRFRRGRGPWWASSPGHEDR